MSNAAAAHSPPPGLAAEAPWRSLLDSHLQSMPSPEFTLATNSAERNLPRTRFCIHRGFFSSPLPENKHNTYTPNPHLFDSDCPTFTTDARMSKVYDIFATGKGKGTLEQSRSGTGGGGPVEACYWVKEKGSQWRITGQCWLISADDVEGSGSSATTNQQNSGTMTVKAQLGRYMRPVSGSAADHHKDWSWSHEVAMHFANLSPGMRGSFKNPPPGEPQQDGNNKSQGEELGQKGEQELEKEDLARKNFRLAVIAPEEVELVDLNDPAKSFRRKWTLDEQKGWKEEVLWP